MSKRHILQKECNVSEYGSSWVVEWYGGDPEDPEIVAGPFGTEEQALAWILALPA